MALLLFLKIKIKIKYCWTLLQHKIAHSAAAKGNVCLPSTLYRLYVSSLTAASLRMIDAVRLTQFCFLCMAPSFRHRHQTLLGHFTMLADRKTARATGDRAAALGRAARWVGYGPRVPSKDNQATTAIRSCLKAATAGRVSLPVRRERHAATAECCPSFSVSNTYSRPTRAMGGLVVLKMLWLPTRCRRSEIKLGEIN